MTEKVSVFLQNIFPVIGQVQTMTGRDLRNDFLAGITVAVMLVPQGMAYAMLAGLPPVIGLYASTVPLIAYALLGTSRQLAVGPVAMVSLLVFTGVSALAEPGTESYTHYVLTLCVLVGGIQVILGIIRAGFIVNYISRAVIGGFTSAAAIIIGVSQLGHILGFDVPRHGSILTKLTHVIRHIHDVHLPTCILGIAAVAALLLFKHLAPRLPGPLLVVIAATVMTGLFRLDTAGVAIVSQVPSGIPLPVLPNLDLDVIRELFPIALTITFIGYMESYAIAQSIATRERQSIGPDRELTALGVADITAGFFSGYPVTGGLSRTAVNYAAGARTNLAGMFTALLIGLALAFFTPLFHYLPKAVLAAVIITAVVSLFEIRLFLELFHIKFGDGLTCLFTFAVTLAAGVETGIVTGVILSLILFIRRSAHPHMAELGFCHERNAYLNINRFPMVERYPRTVIIRVDGSIFFANAGFIRTRTREYIESQPDTRLVVFDFEGVNDMDAVAVKMLETLIDDYDARRVDFAFARLKGPVRDILTRAGWHRKYPHSIRFRSVRQVIADLGITTGNGYSRNMTAGKTGD